MNKLTYLDFRIYFFCSVCKHFVNNLIIYANMQNNEQFLNSPLLVLLLILNTCTCSLFITQNLLVAMAT